MRYVYGNFHSLVSLSGQAPPKGFFLTKIFHPNVAKNGGESWADFFLKSTNYFSSNTNTVAFLSYINIY